MANQTGLQFTVKVGALPESTFVVASFQLDEGLNRPFNLRLELASSQPDVDFGAVLDQPCSSLGNNVGRKTVEQVTLIVNGGLNGYKDRRSRFNKVAEIIGIELDAD